MYRIKKARGCKLEMNLETKLVKGSGILELRSAPPTTIPIIIMGRSTKGEGDYSTIP